MPIRYPHTCTINIFGTPSNVGGSIVDAAKTSYNTVCRVENNRTAWQIVVDGVRRTYEHTIFCPVFDTGGVKDGEVVYEGKTRKILRFKQLQTHYEILI